MSQRLYLNSAQAAIPNSTIRLEREQAHYLSRVLRFKAGARLLCFNGRGVEWRAEIVELDGRSGTLELHQKIRDSEQPAVRLGLAVSWLKGAAMDTVVQKATELGVDTLQILHSQRSNVSLDAKRTDNKLRHWRQIAISASEQSNRLFLPQILAPISLADMLEASADTRLIMLDLDAPLLDTGSEPETLTLLIGPEGGWSNEERSLADASEVEKAGLGELTLRAETAPLAALAAVQQSWHWRRRPVSA